MTGAAMTALRPPVPPRQLTHGHNWGVRGAWPYLRRLVHLTSHARTGCVRESGRAVDEADLRDHLSRPVHHIFKAEAHERFWHRHQPARPMAGPVHDGAFMRPRVVVSDGDMRLLGRFQDVQAQSRCGGGTGQPPTQLGRDHDIAGSIGKRIDGSHPNEVARPHRCSQSTVADALVQQAFPTGGAAVGRDRICRIHLREPGSDAASRRQGRTHLWTSRACGYPAPGHGRLTPAGLHLTHEHNWGARGAWPSVGRLGRISCHPSTGCVRESDRRSAAERQSAWRAASGWRSAL
jgi:hypothetical protein